MTDNFITVMNQEPGYSQKAREFIEALTPPASIRFPESAFDGDSDRREYSHLTRNRSRPFEKGVSHHSIRKKMNPLQRNISLFSYRRPVGNDHIEPDLSTGLDQTLESPAKECAYLQIPQMMKDQPINRKKFLLERLEEQYGVMKHKLQGPGTKSQRQRLRPMPQQEGISCDQFQREIGLKKVHESGVQYFADLYMIKKCRQRNLKNTLLQKVQQKLKPPQLPPIQQVHGNSNANDIIDEWIQRLPEQKEFFTDLKQMTTNQRKKAIQERGPLSNIYYELAALTTDEKRNLRRNHKIGDTSPFKDLV